MGGGGGGSPCIFLLRKGITICYLLIISQKKSIYSNLEVRNPKRIFSIFHPKMWKSQYLGNLNIWEISISGKSQYLGNLNIWEISISGKSQYLGNLNIRGEISISGGGGLVATSKYLNI